MIIEFNNYFRQEIDSKSDIWKSIYDISDMIYGTIMVKINYKIQKNLNDPNDEISFSIRERLI